MKIKVEGQEAIGKRSGREASRKAAKLAKKTPRRILEAWPTLAGV